MDQTKKRKRNTKDNLNVKVSSLRRRGISIGAVLRWLSGSIVFHIDVLRASLKKRAGNSSQVKLNGAKVHFREIFHSIHSKILKACCIIGIQKISVLLRRLEFRWSLDINYSKSMFYCSTFCLFFFFFGFSLQWLTIQLWTVHMCTVTDPQIPLFSNFFIKNGSHGIIHTFKNYFVTVFSISVKINPIQTDPMYTKMNDIFYVNYLINL